MRKRPGLAAIAAAAAALTVAVLLGSPAANAVPPAGTLGPATLNPDHGLDVSAPQLVTSAGCPSTADGYNVYVTGPGKFATPFLIVNTQSVNFSTTAGFPAQFKESMADAAKDLSTTLVAGEYDLTLNCVDTFTLAAHGTFTTAMYFLDPTHYASTPTGATTTTTATTTTAVTTTTGATTTTTATTTTGTTTATTTTGTTGTTTSTTATTTTAAGGPGEGISLSIGGTGTGAAGGGGAGSGGVGSGEGAGGGSGGSTGTSGGGRLASTGVDIALPIAVGAVLLAIGVLYLLAARRRRSG